VSGDFGSNGTYSIQNGKKLKSESRYVNGNFSLEHDWPNKMTTAYRGSFSYDIGKSDVSTNKTNTLFTHTHSLTNSPCEA